jgi:hypothetical protein
MLVGFEPDLEVLDFELRLAVFDLNVPARPEVVRLVEDLRPAEVDFLLFTELLVFFAPVAEVGPRVAVVRPGVDLLCPPAPFERGVSPEATPMRAPDIAPVKAPVSARLKNPLVFLLVRFLSSTVRCGREVDFDLFLAMCVSSSPTDANG